MSDELEATFGFGGGSPGPRKAQGEPLRILLLTDLGETCRSRVDQPLASRPLKRVDIDTLEDYMAAEQPVLHAASGDARLKELDDLHPGQLSKALPVFETLETLCRRLRTPSAFEAAAKEVRAMMQAEVATPEADSGSEDDAETLSRLLGKPAQAAPQAQAPATGEGFLQGLFQKAVQDHIVPDADPRADVYVTAVEAAACAHMRAILHDPGFQAQEAAWRGLDLLVSNIESDEDVSLHVLNASKAELVDAMGPADAAPDGSVLHRRIVAAREGEPFALIVADFGFERENADMRLLATLGAMAGRSGALVLSGVAPEVVGTQGWDRLAEDPGAPLAPDGTWSALRESGIGGHIAAFAPRFVLRAPYGARLNPAETFFDFEELAQPGAADAPLLWGNASVLGALLIAQSFERDGWDARLNTHQDVDDLPLVTYTEDGDKQMRPCAEVFLSDSATEAMRAAGPVPVVAVRHQNAVRLSGFQSIAAAGAGGRLGPFDL